MVSKEMLTQYREAACEAARRGAAVLEEWRHRFQVREKGRFDLVTEADLGSQRAIRDFFAQRFPDHHFLGEEERTGPARLEPGAPPTWIVDPLDGTTNYVHDCPLYCVSIGLQVAGELVVGVVLDPSRQENGGTGPFPCFTQFDTLASLLDPANVSWAYYAPSVTGRDNGGRVWSEFDSISAIRHGRDWTHNVISPPSTILNDAASGRLPAVSWVIPDAGDSDHTGEGRDDGPSWVSSVVNAVGESSNWSSTAIVVLWDDWGGWYDNAPPPQLDYRGLGERVPCIIISPYARKSFVSHTDYEFGSIVKFVEEVFALRPLESLGVGSGYTDSRAYSISNVFDFNQKARAFQPIASTYDRAYFLTEKPSQQPPDDN